MVFDLSTVGNLTEITSSFTFRNEGQIKIPKSKREVAYTMSVDIIIESVAYPQYKNGKSNPSLSFYGYVTLVFQDCFIIEVPLTFSRQRVYFDRQYQALILWQNEMKFWENRQYHRQSNLGLFNIMSAFEIPYEEISIATKDFNWIELPLREVYVKTLFPTQFTIEYTQIEPIPYTDPFGNERDGKSNQTDGDKDNGIPSAGLQPKENGPTDPFGGNNPENTPTLDGGFLLNKDKLSSVPASNGLGGIGGSQSLCSVNVTSRTDRGLLINSLNYTNVIVPFGSSFIVESLPNDGSLIPILPADTDGSFDAVKVIPSGLYFDGSGFSTSVSAWTSGKATVTASCSLIE